MLRDRLIVRRRYLLFLLYLRSSILLTYRILYIELIKRLSLIVYYL